MQRSSCPPRKGKCRPQARLARPGCEFLEGRVLPAVSLFPPAPEAAGTQTSPVSYERVLTALATVQALVTLEPISSLAPASWDLDLDGDGLDDRVSLELLPGASASSLVVMRGDGAGGFEKVEQVSLGYVARCLLATDLDGDDKVDLFAVSDRPGEGTLFLGHGNGTFDIARRTAPEVALAVADLTGDGLDDFVYANHALDRIAIELTGQGRSVLADGPTGMIGPRKVHLADLDGDRVMDLIVCTGGESVLVYPGLGKGEFGPEINGGKGLFIGINPAHVAVARLGDDFGVGFPGSPGNDPFLDLIVASEGSDEVVVFHGRGGMNFVPGLRLHVGWGPSSVQVHDLTKDGLLDLVVTSLAQNSVWILPGLVGGLFDDQHPRILPTGLAPLGAHLGDFDGDGRDDLVTLDSGSDSLTYYSDVASPQSVPRTIPSGGDQPTAALVRDVDDDGDSDLIVANRGNGQLVLFTGGPEGLTPSQSMQSPGGRPTALAESSQESNPWRFYVAHEGSEEAILVEFASPDLPESTAPDTGEEPPVLAGEPSRVETELESLSASSFALVPALVVTLDGDDTEVLPMPRVDPLEPGEAKAPDDRSGGGDEREEAAPPSNEMGENVAMESDDQLKIRQYQLGLDESEAPIVEADAAGSESGSDHLAPGRTGPPRVILPRQVVPVVESVSELPMPQEETGPRWEEAGLEPVVIAEESRLIDLVLVLSATGLASDRRRPAARRAP